MIWECSNTVVCTAVNQTTRKEITNGSEEKSKEKESS
jgi:hypothetical protein